MPGRDIDNVDAAVNLEGLTDEQRDELSDRIHEEKWADRRDISFQEIRRMAREIKLEWEGREDEIEPTQEERERTQTRGVKNINATTAYPERRRQRVEVNSKSEGRLVMVTAQVDERKEMHGSEDFGKLGSMLRDYLHGESVQRVTVGAELVFHIGTPQAYQTAGMKGHVRGSWQLRVMRSPWQIRPMKKEGVTITAGLPIPFGEPLSQDEVEAQFERLFKGTHVENLQVTETADLFVSFSNGYALVLFCKYAPADATKVLWKLSTPYKMAIHVFGEPASCWSCLRSDVPRREA